MEKTIGVNGMTCGHCEEAVRGALEQLNGVQDVAIDLKEGNVKVNYDEDLVTLGDIRDAIENQGYDVLQ